MYYSLVLGFYIHGLTRCQDMLLLGMMWFKKNALVIGGIIAASVIWAYSTFATIEFVESQHTEVMRVLERIDSRLWLLIKPDHD